MPHSERGILYPHLSMRLVGEDGNAFAILGRLRRVLEQGRVPKDEIDNVMLEAKSGDYDHLLGTVLMTVDCDPEELDSELDECIRCSEPNAQYEDADGEPLCYDCHAQDAEHAYERGRERTS